MAWADLALAAVMIYAFGMGSGMWLMGYHFRNNGSILRGNRIEYDQ